MSPSLFWQIGFLLLALVLQLSRLNHFPPFSLYLSWLLVVVVCWSMLFGRWSGVMAGLLAGGLQDFVTGSTAVHWLSFALVGYVTGHTSLVVLRHNYGLVALAVITATFLCELLQTTVLSLQQHPWAWPDFLNLILPLCLGNAVAALPLFQLLQYLGPRIRTAG